MDNEPASELAEFHRFLGEKLGKGNVDISPEEALDEWSAEYPTDEMIAESVAALKTALAGAGVGGKPIAEVLVEMRNKHKTSQESGED